MRWSSSDLRAPSSIGAAMVSPRTNVGINNPARRSRQDYPRIGREQKVKREEEDWADVVVKREEESQ